MNFAGVPIVLIVVSLVLVALGAWVLLRQQWLLQWTFGLMSHISGVSGILRITSRLH